MLERLAERQAAATESTLGDRQSRQWVVRVIALLLVVQALALLVVSGATGLALNWPRELGRIVLSLRGVGYDAVTRRAGAGCDFRDRYGDWHMAGA